MEHVPLVTMAGKKNSLLSCYFMDTLTGLGAQVKEHMGKRSTETSSFPLSKFGAVLKVLVPSYSYILLTFHTQCIIYRCASSAWCVGML